MATATVTATKRKAAEISTADESASAEEVVQGVETDDGVAFELGNKKLLRVKDYKGRTLIDIREFYEDKAGDLKPGKKGISLTLEQWDELAKAFTGIQATIEAARNK